MTVTKDAIREANAAIARIKVEFKKDVAIETLSKSPELPKEVDAGDAAAVNKFFIAWNVERAWPQICASAASMSRSCVGSTGMAAGAGSTIASLAGTGACSIVLSRRARSVTSRSTMSTDPGRPSSGGIGTAVASTMRPAPVSVVSDTCSER